MRERFLEAFDEITIDCLNGDKFKTGKLTPDGEPDPSIFSTEVNKEGIQVGTAIAMLVRRPLTRPTSAGASTGEKVDAASGALLSSAFLRFGQFWGKQKRKELLESLSKDDGQTYQALVPVSRLGLAFVPMVVGSGYLEWPKLPELLPRSFPGVKTSRDEGVVHVERGALEQRILDYLNPAVSHDEMRRRCPALVDSPKTEDVNKRKATREILEKIREELRRHRSDTIRVVRYAYRPLDNRWLAWAASTKLLDRNRADYAEQVLEGNIWLSAGQRNRKEDFYTPQVTRVLADHHLVESNVGMFPLYLRTSHSSTGPLFDQQSTIEIHPNITPSTEAYLSQLYSNEQALFFHIVAVLHAPTYREENAGALRQDWPRVPLPATREALEASAALGRQIAALLDPETPVPWRDGRRDSSPN